VNTTCLYYLNIAAEKLIEKISSADVPHDIATYRDRLYGISSVMQHWLSLASSITHPQVTKAMDLNAELLLLHRTTSVRTDVIHGLPVEISVVAWADDGSAFGLGCTDGLVQVWQVSNIKRTAHMRDPHANPVRAVAFSPDHSLIASGSNDGTIYVWDIATETIKHTLSVHRQDISALAFSPDGLRIVSSAGFIAHVSDPSTGKTVSSVQDTQRISAVGFSADGKQIACGSDAGPIQICDAQTGSLVTRLDAPASVEALTFEGHKLVSRHQDNTTRTWDLEPLFSSEEPHTLTLVPEASASSLLTLGSDMRSLYARNITGDEQALIYRLRPGEQVTSTTERHGTKVVFGTLKGRIVLLDYNYVFPPFPSSKS
jgi:WD40 repeat protein